MRSKLNGMLSVVRLELRRNLKSRKTVATVGILFTTCVIFTFNIFRIYDFRTSYRRTTNNFLLFHNDADFLFIELARDPIIALFLICFAMLMGSHAIAESHENGTLRVLQTLPYDRRCVFVGIVLARVVVVVSVVTSVVGLAFLRAYQLGYDPSVALLFPFIGAMSLHLIGFLSIGAALSTLERRSTAIHSLALLLAIGLSVLYVPLSRLAPETAVAAPRQVFYALVAALDDRWHVHSGISTPAAVSVQLALIVVPLLYGLYRYERCDLTT